MYVAALSDSSSRQQIGGKAFFLLEMQKRGVENVPDTYVVHRDAMRESVLHHNLESAVSNYLDDFELRSHSENKTQWRGLCERFTQAGIPQPIWYKIQEIAERLFVQANFGLAVRSSAINEDSFEASFSGVFESCLGVASANHLQEAILQCWCSSWSPDAVRYSKKFGIEMDVAPMAVILQPLLAADFSGVINTANPDNGNPNQFLIEIVSGLSADLMDGIENGTRLEYDVAKDQLVTKDSAPQTTIITATEEGIIRQDPSCDKVPNEFNRQQILKLVECAAKLDDAFGFRLNIEFVVIGQELWLVQLRPLTALPSYFPDELSADDSQLTWQPLQFLVPLRSDAPAGLITPFYSDLSDAELWMRYQPDDITLTVFCRRIKDVNGYRFFLQEQLPTFIDHFDNPLEYESWLSKNETVYRDRWENLDVELNSIVERSKSAIADPASTAEFISQTIQISNDLWDLNSFGWSGPQSLGWMCDSLFTTFVGRYLPSFDISNVILSGAESFSFKVTHALQQLGKSITERHIRDIFVNTQLDKVLEVIQTEFPNCKFIEEYEAFCWTFGKTPLSWANRPGFWELGSSHLTMIQAIKTAMLATAKDVVDAKLSSRELRDRDESNLLKEFQTVAPQMIPRLERIIEWARFWGKALNDRHSLTIGLLWERELIWRLGTQLTNDGILKCPEEVLLLHKSDLELYDQNDNRQALKDIVKIRRREMKAHLRLTPPINIGSVSNDQRPGTESVQLDESNAGQDPQFTGTGEAIGRGEVFGTARPVVDINDPELLDNLTSADILILPHEYAFHYADWHSLLTMVAGVLSNGKPSHHLAQVARECNVPIISVNGGLSEINQGQQVYLNADRGEYRVDP